MDVRSPPTDLGVLGAGLKSRLAAAACGSNERRRRPRRRRSRKGGRWHAEWSGMTSIYVRRRRLRQRLAVSPAEPTELPVAGSADDPDDWILGNHDQKRIAGRLGAAQARVAAMLLVTLRGLPDLYYGAISGSASFRLLMMVPCGWERVERFFNKLKHFRAIATRYDSSPRLSLPAFSSPAPPSSSTEHRP